MEIQCKECGGKSPMGAIFCRECGAKLNMDDMRPKVIQSSSAGGFKLTRYAVKKIFSLLISVAIFGCLAMLFMNGSPEMPPPPAAKNGPLIVALLQKEISSFKEDKKRTKKNLTINADWLSHYFLNEFVERQKAQVGDSTLVHKEAIFEFYDDNQIRMDLRSEMNSFGVKLDITCTLVLGFENTATGVDFYIVSSKHGKVPLPGFAAEKVVTPRFKSLIPVEEDLDQLRDQIKSLTISDDKLTVILK